ncbi:MAG: ribosomal protein S18-alanine N-acetyltransferase [Hyphomicrobiales bacterium]
MSHHFLPITDQFADMAKIHGQSFAKAWSESTFRDMFEDGVQYSGFVIHNEQHIVGFSIISKIIDEAEIITICVLPEMQGQAFGTALLQYQLDHLRQQDFKKLFLEVNENNHSAICLYKKMGFTQTASRKNYYRLADGSVADALVFALIL